jgi:hypothetical protein
MKKALSFLQDFNFDLRAIMCQYAESIFNCILELEEAGEAPSI